VPSGGGGNGFVLGRRAQARSRRSCLAAMCSTCVILACNFLCVRVEGLDGRVLVLVGLTRCVGVAGRRARSCGCDRGHSFGALAWSASVV
jgi:hypothetical protein